MEALGHARKLANEGRFVDALATLQSSRTSHANQSSAETLKAELLERLGRTREAAERVERLLRSRGLTAYDRSLCYYILARIEGWKGRYDSAVMHLQKSAS